MILIHGTTYVNEYKEMSMIYMGEHTLANAIPRIACLGPRKIDVWVVIPFEANYINFTIPIKVNSFQSPINFNGGTTL